MGLRLRVVSDHRRALGPRGSVVFGVGGGTIGRSGENDWILPDPSRYVSGRHARILFRHGSYFFEDTSTNGTYLNDADAPMSKQMPCELHHGDVLVVGEYHIVVSIDSTGEGAPERTATVDLERELLGDSGVRAAATLPPQVEGHLDASLNTNALFADAARSDSFRVGNAFGQAVVVPFGNARPPAPKTPAESSDIIAARRMERLRRVAGERAAGATATDARPGLEALCRGAGIEPGALPPGAAAAMLQLAGRLLREAVVGLKDLHLKQTEQGQTFGLGPLRVGNEDPPFKLATPVDELLVQMLASHGSRRLDAGQWMRQNFDQAKRHDDGLAAGALAACEELIRQLEPKELEGRFERSAKRNLMGARPSNWELYRELHRTLTELPEPGRLPHLAAEKLASAYQEAIKPAVRD